MVGHRLLVDNVRLVLVQCACCATYHGSARNGVRDDRNRICQTEQASGPGCGPELRHPGGCDPEAHWDGRCRDPLRPGSVRWCGQGEVAAGLPDAAGQTRVRRVDGDLRSEPLPAGQIGSGTSPDHGYGQDAQVQGDYGQGRDAGSHHNYRAVDVRNLRTPSGVRPRPGRRRCSGERSGSARPW